MCASTLLFVACDRHSTGRLLSRPGYTRVTPARRLLHRPATQPDHGMPSASTRIPANGLPALTTLSRPLQTGTAHLMIRPLLPARATRAPVLTALCHVPARAGPGTAPRHGPGLLGTSRPLRPGRRRRCALTRLGPDTRVTYPGRPAPTPRPALLQNLSTSHTHGPGAVTVADAAPGPPGPTAPRPMRLGLASDPAPRLVATDIGRYYQLFSCQSWHPKRRNKWGTSSTTSLRGPARHRANAIPNQQRVSYTTPVCISTDGARRLHTQRHY